MLYTGEHNGKIALSLFLIVSEFIPRTVRTKPQFSQFIQRFSYLGENEMVEVRLLEPAHATELTRLYAENREALRPFEPIRDERFYTVEGQRAIIASTLTDDANYLFGIFKQDNGCLIGRISLTGVIRGTFLNGCLGYWIDAGQRNKGYMTMAVLQVVSFAFLGLKLHRLEANAMTFNKPSLKVLEKCGFERIGCASKYLCINGVWQDHYLHQLINEYV